VIAVATELGIPFEKIAASLRKFEHARRRFEIKYASERFLLVDDYAHHPTEIRATLKTARSAGRKRVLTMFQPHRYSRTSALRKEFGAAFADSDRVVITDVYPASENPIPGISGQTIVDEILAYGHAGVSYQPRLEWVHRDVGNAIRTRRKTFYKEPGQHTDIGNAQRGEHRVDDLPPKQWSCDGSHLQ